MFENTKKLWLTEPDIQKEEPAKIAAPTLVMVGDRDSVIPEHTIELFGSIKRAQLCVIPGTAHFLLSEKPSIANRVLEFLQANPKTEKWAALADGSLTLTRILVPMRKVVVSMFLSLDGFVVGPREEMDWVIGNFDNEGTVR